MLVEAQMGPNYLMCGTSGSEALLPAMSVAPQVQEEEAGNRELLNFHPHKAPSVPMQSLQQRNPPRKEGGFVCSASQ
jgi:hypothetical protein